VLPSLKECYVSAKKQLTTDQLIAKVLHPSVNRVAVNGRQVWRTAEAIRSDSHFDPDSPIKSHTVIYAANSDYEIEEVYKWEPRLKVYKLWFMYTRKLPSTSHYFQFWCNGTPADEVIRVSQSVFPDDPPFVKSNSTASKGSKHSETHRELL